MISRAFGALPAPAGHMARVSLTDVQYTDIPDWAEAEVKNLVQAGVLVGDGESSLASEEPVTAEQVDTIVRRIYSLLGKNKKDDFYASVNRGMAEPECDQARGCEHRNLYGASESGG